MKQAKLLIILVMAGTVNLFAQVTHTAVSVSYSDVNAVINGGSDSAGKTWAPLNNGDICVIPAGSASWTSYITITKGITILGATTVSGDHSTTLSGTPMAAHDQTTIIDNVPRTNGNAVLISVPHLTATQTLRISGITFSQGSIAQAANNGSINFNGACICPNVRIDHCHFYHLQNQPNLLFNGWIYGVVDHNIFDCSGNVQAIYAGMGGYNNDITLQGDQSWADAPNYGSNKFIFIEDNTFNTTGTNTSTGSMDATPAGRYVERYNVINNVGMTGGHGTEFGGYRGVRAREYYGNVIYPGSNWSGGFQGIARSGSFLSYNNNWQTTDSGLVGGKSLETFRLFWGGGGHYAPFNGATGANAWDYNETSDHTGNGYGGGANGLYASGTHTGATGATTLTDSSANWPTNLWANYEIVNTVSGNNGMILSNTSNTITYSVYTDQGGPLKFNSGDGYQIHKVLVPLDGLGRGKGDLITRVGGKTMQPVNSTTGTVAWTHQKLEPCYSWDSYNGAPVNIKLGGDQGNVWAANRDYYNLNTSWAPGQALTTGVALGTIANRPTQCTSGTDITGVTNNPPGVGYWATDVGPSNQNGGVSGTLYVCTATNTWTQYYQPYVYPHPLVSGAPAPPAAPKNLRVVH